MEYYTDWEMITRMNRTDTPIELLEPVTGTADSSEKKMKLLGYYNYTVILTYIGMLAGFLGVVFAFDHHTFGAILCLMTAGLCDMFDGVIASTRDRTRQEKCFGIQIDSFSDLICFGALPAVIVYSRSGQSRIVAAVCSLYLLCALIRLAYFNVDEQERQETCDTSREIYFGLPVTLSALFLPIVLSASGLFAWQTVAAPALTLLVMAVLFLLPFRLTKPKLIGKLCVLLCGILAFGFVLFTRSLL